MSVAQPTRVHADPRPAVTDDPDGPAAVGVRCLACGHPSSMRVPRCPRCGGETQEARFAGEGTIWATTTIHVPSGDREAPYTLAYVDLDDGPRLLAHVHDGPELHPAVAARVRLIGQTPEGDPEVEVSG